MRKMLALVLIVGLSACAGSYTPTVDAAVSHPRPGATFEADLNDCRALAGQKSPARSAAGGAAIGAGLGAAIGAIIGAATGAAVGGGLGGVSGGVSGASGTAAQQRGMVDACMRGRGWAVL